MPRWSRRSRSPLDTPARRYGAVAAGLVLTGLVALNVLPLAGGLVTVALVAWLGSWALAVYYALVAHRLARWGEIADAWEVDRRHTGGLPAYETTVAGTPVTLTARRRGRLRPSFTTVAETAPAADLDPGSARDRVGRHGTVSVAGDAVRVEWPGLLDPAGLETVSEAVAAATGAEETTRPRTRPTPSGDA